MAVTALIISILALLASAASVLYTRLQAIHAGTAVSIEKDRRRAERTPTLLVKPVSRYHDDPNEHAAEVNVTNTAPFGLRNIAVQAVQDRPGKYAIIAIRDENGYAERTILPVTELGPGQTTSFSVVLAHAGERSKSGVVLLTVHDAEGNEWVLESEINFPRQPRAFVF